MSAEGIQELKRVASDALARFEDRVPYLLWNEANAVTVVGKNPPFDIETYHDALDAWEKDLRLQLKLSAELRDAQYALAEVLASRRRRRGALNEINENQNKRDSDLKRGLERVRTLRTLRPR